MNKNKIRRATIMPLSLVFQAQAKFQLKCMAAGEHLRSPVAIYVVSLAQIKSS